MTADELVEVDVEVVVARPVHGSGVQLPGPRFAPPAESHAAAGSSWQVNAPPGDVNAPEAEVGTQHWITSPTAVVEVDDEVDVVVIELLVSLEVLVVVDVVLVVSAVHEVSVHVPGPMSVPPMVVQSAGDSSAQTKAPVALPGRQHRVVAGTHVPLPQASQQLENAPAQAVPPCGGVQCAASFAIRHLVRPLASVRQQVTAPGEPQVELRAHFVTAFRQGGERVEALITALAQRV